MDHSKGDEHDHSDQEAKITTFKEGKVTIKVNGMVCAFCAQGITKNFKKKKEVNSVNVDLDEMEVTIDVKKGMTLSKKVIEEVITEAGFKYVGVK